MNLSYRVLHSGLGDELDEQGSSATSSNGFLDPTIRTTECLCDASVDGTQASDHYGVVAQLEVPLRCPGKWG